MLRMQITQMQQERESLAAEKQQLNEMVVDFREKYEQNVSALLPMV